MKREIHSNMSNKRILKNSIYIYLRLAVVMILSLLTTRVLLAALGVVDYGLYNVICGFVGLFSFLNTSMSNGIQRFYNFEISVNGNEGAVKVYNLALRIQLLIAIFILILAETIGLWYINTELVIPNGKIFASNCIYQCSIISFLFVILQVPYSSIVMAYERMNYFAIVSVCDAILKIIIAFLIKFSSNDKLILYGILIMFISILNYIFYFTYCKYHFKHIKVLKIFDKSLFKSMFSFSGWNLFGSFAFVVKSQGTNLLLNSFFGTVVNAANAISSQVSFALQAFASNLIIAFKPQLVHSYATNDYQRTSNLLNSMSKMSFLLFSFLAIPIIFEIDFILKLWLGDTIPDYTSILCILTIVATGIGCLHTPITQVVHATGKMKNFQIITGIIMCSIVPVSWGALMLGASPEYVFIITIIITIINQIVSTLVLYSLFKFNIKQYLLDVILKCTIYSIVLSLILLAINILLLPSTLRFFISLIGALMSLLFIPLLLNKSEFTLVKTFLKI